ncbi:ABC transporter permease [Catalinimonas sp. 4WD22]|uniref:ABC transporter permease n=1 Tax=Catalinimonas locisalis TaxID=3133978 RepID=UPI003100ECA8
MFRNYLITAWRNILKNRTFTIINVLGLAFGMAACMLVLQYVGFELTYDSFHTKKDRIYRVGINVFRENTWTKWLVTGPGYIQIKQDFPEVENMVRLVDIWEVLLTHESEKGEPVHQNVKGVFYADSTLFEVFDFKLSQGNPDKVLREQNRMLISESTATKWFGDQDPVGKTLILNRVESFVIEGVFEDVPKNSHIHFDYLLSFSSLKPRFYLPLDNEMLPLDNDMLFDDTYTYLLLHNGVEPHDFIKKLNSKLKSYFAYLGRSFGEWSGNFFLQPLREIQTTTDLKKDVAPRQNPGKLYALALVGILILFMAWINYINLATVRSIERSKEVGIRKATGATRIQLIVQFMTEAIMLNIVSFLLAIIITTLSQSYYSQITGWTDASQLWYLPSFWITLIISFLLGSLLSGLYPAFIITAYRPVKALKGGYKSSTGGRNIRNILTIVQFAASVTLIIGTLIIYSQISFLQHQELGFEQEQTFVIRVPIHNTASEGSYDVFKQRVQNIKGVHQVTSSSNIPGKKNPKGEGSRIRVHKKDDLIELHEFDTFGGVDYNFLEFYNIKLKAGRDFQSNNLADRTAFIVSEKVVSRLGFGSLEEAIGEPLILNSGYRYKNSTIEESKGWIIGVIEEVDLVAPNLRKHEAGSSGDLGLILTLKDYLSPSFVPQFFCLKVDMSNWKQTEAQIKAAFQEVYHDELYEYFFQDEYYNRQYQADIQFLSIFVFFALQAIFIACLGLFGLAAFQVQKRSKEIGIRKALGATIADIWLLLAKDLLKALLIASVIGIPLINYFMKSWLEEFVYKIPLSWWMFVMPVLLLILIALLTVSQHLRKAARLNPVKLLRYE